MQSCSTCNNNWRISSSKFDTPLILLKICCKVSINILLIYFTMNCINSLLTLFLLLLQCHTQNSAPLQLSKNAYMASGIIHLILGRYSISLTGFTSAVFQDNFFTTPFVNTIYNIAQVYYSTAEMDAETCSPYYPNTLLNFIWY
jgi:hypothetical protein